MAEGERQRRRVRASVTFPREHYEALLEMARGKKVSLAWVVRDAVEDYLAADTPLFAQQVRLHAQETEDE